MLLLFFQGSYAAPFADVPRINSAGRRKKHIVEPVAIIPDFGAGIERQVIAAVAREATALARLHVLESKATAQLETLAKATVARRKAAVVKQRALVAALNNEIETLNAAMAVEEADVVFIFSILSEA